MSNHFIFTHALENLCQNALDLSNNKLTIENNWKYGTYCQWLISAVDDKHYVIFEFKNIDVRIAEFGRLFKYLTLLFN